MTGCACLTSNYDGEGLDFSSAEIRKARKPHRCCECRDQIQPGERYEFVAGSWDGDFLTFKTCLICVEIRTAFSCDGSYQFECLWGDLEEVVYPEFSVCCLLPLSIAAQRKIAAHWDRWNDAMERL